MKPMRCLLAALVLLAMLAVAAGCGSKRSPATAPSTSLSPYARAMDNVVGNYAEYLGSGDVIVRGYGLVVGLGDKGAGKAPREVVQKIIAQAKHYGLGQANTNTEDITPERLIADRDTAAVVVSAELPPGTPKGAPIDAMVSALPGSPTISLAGGSLFMTELTRVQAEGGRLREGQPIATVKGEVFVNPFPGAADTSEATGQLQGRIIGGCTALEQRPIRLALRHADYGLAQAIQDAINEKYPAVPHVAKAISPQQIEIRIPQAFRGQHEHFLALVQHVYVPRNGMAQEYKARQLADLIGQPGAAYQDISLIWETMGRQVWPVVRPLYTDASPSVAYFAARAAMRQGDRQALEVVIFAARDAGNPHRMMAIEELGRSTEMAALDTLRGLLDADETPVRVAAYEAIAAGGLAEGIQRISVDGGRFEIDIVPTRGKFLIYASQERRQRLALFGEGMQITHPIYFSAPDDVATVLAREGDESLCVFRRVGASRQLSDPMRVGFDVKSLVTVLGTRPRKEKDGSYYGLGLTYSQVVGVLYRLCQEGSERRIPAEFILQRSGQADRIYTGPEPISRPDTTSGQ